jgi:hypothetical protein
VNKLNNNTYVGSGLNLSKRVIPGARSALGCASLGDYYKKSELNSLASIPSGLGKEVLFFN